MSGFLGTATLSLDAKGRVTVPVRHRDKLIALCEGRVILTKHPTRCLQIFPEPVWETFYERLMALPEEANDWRRLFVGSATPVEMDSGSRLMVAPELRSFAGLSQDGGVLMVGMGKRLELWDAARHNAIEETTLASEMPAPVKGFVF